MTKNNSGSGIVVEGVFTITSIKTLLNMLDPNDPNEQCIVLRGPKPPDQRTYLVSDGYKVPNRHEEPRHHFRVLQRDIPTGVLRSMVGVLHTHGPGDSPGPSYEDVQRLRPDHVGIVYHTPSRRVTLFDHTGFLDTFIVQE